MKASFRLGTIAGIRVGVHWSVALIFVIIATSLSGAYFPDAYPDEPTALHVAAGLLTATAFFGSLLAHEISHAVVARHHGIDVDGITLWLLGGVARLRAEASDPRTEMRVAGIGPLVSVGLGLGFALAAGALDSSGHDSVLVGALAWLGAINIALGVFNSIPAAPLDGGRLLRSVIWRWTGDRYRATRYASLAGQGFGWLLVVVGLGTTVGGAGLGGLWLVLVGWFLIGAATAESTSATVRQHLGTLRVQDIMTPHPVAAPATMTVEELLQSDLIRGRHSTFPLTGQSGAPVALLTFSQVRRVAPGARATTRLVDVACPLDEVALTDLEELAADLLPRLTDGADGRALVLLDGELVGIVSPSDLNRVLRWTSVGRVGAGL